MAPRSPCGAHFGRHFLRRDQPLVVKVAALFRQHLIFELDASRASIFQFANRPDYVKHSTEACIGID